MDTRDNEIDAGRRDFMKLAGGSAVALLTGCTATGAPALPTVPVAVTIPQDVSTLIDDANSIVTKVEAVAGPAVAQAGAVWTEIKTALAAINGAPSTTAAGSSVSTFATDVQKVLSFVAPAGTGGQLIAAVEAVLPEMLQLAGVIVPLLGRAPMRMDIVDAKKYLHS